MQSVRSLALFSLSFVVVLVYLQVEEAGSASPGASFISDLVAFRVAQTMEEMSDLLAEDSFEGVWGSVWHLVPECNVAEAKALIVSLVLQAASGWQMRFMDAVEGWPLLLLVCLESAPHVACIRRQYVAEKLLGECVACLREKLGDITWKIREVYKRDWEHMRSSGMCCRGLFAVLLTLRGVLHGDTQEIEGWNNVLQLMGRRARSMRIPLASARMKLKHGARITPEQCCAVAGEIKREMHTSEYADRFRPVEEHVPSAHATAAAGSAQCHEPSCCMHHDPLLVKAALLAHPVKNSIEQTALHAMYVYIISKVAGKNLVTSNKGFVLSFSFYSTLWCNSGNISSASGEKTFHLILPLRPVKLVFLVKDAIAAHDAEDPQRQAASATEFTLAKYRARWMSPSTCRLDAGSVQEIDIKSRAPKRKRPEHEARPDGGPDEDGVSDLLAEMLSEIPWGDNDDNVGEVPTDVWAEHGEEHGDEHEDEEADSDVDVPDCGEHDNDLSDLEEPSSGTSRPVAHYLEAVPKEGMPALLAAVASACKRGAGLIDEGIKETAKRQRVPEKGDISLVEARRPVDATSCSYEAIFLRWDDAQAKPPRARRIRLDRFDRVIFNVAFVVPSEEWPQDCISIVLSKLPVRMWRERAEGRDKMPSWAVALQQQLSAKHCSGPLVVTHEDAVNDLGRVCVVCRCAQEQEVVAPVWGAERESFRCHQCVSVWHAECALHLAGARAAEVTLDPFACPWCLGCLGTGCR